PSVMTGASYAKVLHTETPTGKLCLNAGPRGSLEGADWRRFRQRSIGDVPFYPSFCRGHCIDGGQHLGASSLRASARGYAVARPKPLTPQTTRCGGCSAWLRLDCRPMESWVDR